MIKYRWQRCPHPSRNVIHVDRQLPSTTDHDWAPEETEGNDREFIRLLRAVRGVEDVMITDRYSASIGKGELFDWPEIRPAVLEVFRRRFGEMEEVAAGLDRDAHAGDGEGKS